MSEVKGQVQMSSPVSNQCTSFSFHINPTNHSWDMDKIVFHHEKIHLEFFKKICQNNSFCLHACTHTLQCYAACMIAVTPPPPPPPPPPPHTHTHTHYNAVLPACFLSTSPTIMLCCLHACCPPPPLQCCTACMYVNHPLTIMLCCLHACCPPPPL